MNATTLSPIATRFAWKEYRTLRGFWLAALVIGVAVQWVSYAVGPPNVDLPTSFFGIALGAAALYAVGVAATTFSMEHEEETYGFLSGLPARWFPLFAGKLSFAAASVFALAVALSLSGWLLTDMRAPSTEKAVSILAVFGFATIEMLAWGTFFSLLLRQPLLAALLAIAAESLALTWAVNMFAQGNLPAMSLESYAEVLPARLAIVVCVVVVDILLARRWLVLDGRCATTLAESADDSTSATPTFRSVVRFAVAPLRALARCYNPRVLSHLLWQAWRQSWKPMLAMTVIVPLVCISIVLISGLGRLAENLRNNQIALLPFAFALFATALYWSVVFYADQRNRKYRFLAEHAVWPRYVWVTRLAIWSLPIILALAIAAALTASGVCDLLSYWRRHVEQMVRWRYQHWDFSYMAREWQSADYITLFGLWGALLGFALGQATSFFFRRALVAGFAAIVITVPLLVWGAAIWTWELSPYVFALPLVLGLVAATWFRAPDWLVDRNSFTGWLKVFAALALPLAFIAWRLPAARSIPDGIQREAIWQIQESIGAQFVEPLDFHMPFDAAQIVSDWVERSSRQISREQQTTVERLIRLAETIDLPPRLGGGEMGEMRGEMRMEADAEVEAYARRKVELNQPIIREATKLSRDDYRLSISDASFGRMDYLIYLLGDAGRVAMFDGDLEASLDYYLASLAIWEKLWSSRSTDTLASADSRQQFQAKLVDWANAKGQTSERIKRAVAALDSIYPPVKELQPGVQGIDSLSSWTPPPQIVATYESLRNIVVGKEPSGLLDKNADLDDYAAVIANELPFERERALKILDLLMINEVAQWRDVIWRTNQQLLQDWAKDTIKARGEGGIDDMGQVLCYRIQRGYSYSFGVDNEYSIQDDYPPYSWLRTSALLRMELERRRPFGDWLASVVDAQIAAWGLRQQLALIAYRLDHDAYPEELSDLAPDYLPFVPIDPYSGRAFEYRPEGLPLEFRYENDRLEPHTPFLWSVGPGNEHLEIRITVDAVDPMADPSQDAVDVRHEIYVLQSNNSSWRLSRPLVFPLPK